MGVQEGIRFCDACGRTLGATEKLHASGSAWVCHGCLPAASVAQAVEDWPPATRQRRTVSARPSRRRASGLAKGSLVAAVAAALVGLIPGIGLFGWFIAGLGGLLALIGLILALAVPARNEGAGLPVAGLAACVAASVIIVVAQGFWIVGMQRDLQAETERMWSEAERDASGR